MAEQVAKGSHDLARMLNPKTIAVIGGAPAARVVEQCQKLGYKGKIWPVHPTKNEIHGVKCFASIADLPAPPDAAFIAVNRRLTIEAVKALRKIGAGGAVCYASGFAESGETEMQQELLDAAGELALLGPNCYGYINALDGVALWPDEHGCSPVTRGAGIISQSGNVGVNLTMQQRGLEMAYMVTVGNQAGGGVEDVLEAFVNDDRVSAIGMFIEAIREPARFAKLSKLAADRNKRIVALQSGKSDAGALIAASHTASLAGQRSAYAALFARCGIATVETPAELVETLKLLHTGGPLSGSRMVSLSCSGGEASLVADLAEATLLKFEPFPDEQRLRIEATLSELVSVGNPFDYHTFMWGDRDAMASTFAAVMNGNHDTSMLILDAPPRENQDSSSWLVAAEAFADAARATGRRGVVVATLPELLSEPMRRSIAKRGMVGLQGLRESLVALDRCAWLGANHPGAAPHQVTRPAATIIIDEAASKQLLAKWGIATPLGKRCGRTGVTAAANEIGFPVALKGLGIAHKSEHGAVVVEIANRSELEAALTAMPVEIDEFLVEQTIVGAVAEVLVSVRRAWPLGWLITVGAGGVLTEIWRDTSCLLAPASRQEISEAVNGLRIAPILHGYRGKPAANIAALVECIAKLSEAVVGTDIAEVELNPVLVTATSAIAVDALIIQVTP